MNCISIQLETITKISFANNAKTCAAESNTSFLLIQTRVLITFNKYIYESDPMNRQDNQPDPHACMHTSLWWPNFKLIIINEVCTDLFGIESGWLLVSSFFFFAIQNEIRFGNHSALSFVRSIWWIEFIWKDAICNDKHIYQMTSSRTIVRLWMKSDRLCVAHFVPQFRKMEAQMAKNYIYDKLCSVWCSSSSSFTQQMVATSNTNTRESLRRHHHCRRVAKAFFRYFESIIAIFFASMPFYSAQKLSAPEKSYRKFSNGKEMDFTMYNARERERVDSGFYSKDLSGFDVFSVYFDGCLSFFVLPRDFRALTTCNAIRVVWIKSRRLKC